jgi:hypothetical protein
MSEILIPKYSTEFFLTFRSVDRFVFRASDVWALDHHVAKESRERLDNCHLYMLCKRPRLSLVPGTLEFGSDRVSFQVECKIGGALHRASFNVAREAFISEERTFEISAYPHRDLVSRDQHGQIIVETLPATFAHLIRELPDEARDLEVMYIGKGLSKSAHDRLKQHETLQRILGDINSHDPDAEAFVLVYAFKYTKDLTAFSNLPVEIAGEAAKQHRRRAMDYRPSLEERVALVEATCIGHFQPNRYNTARCEARGPDPAGRRWARTREGVKPYRHSW